MYNIDERILKSAKARRNQNRRNYVPRLRGRAGESLRQEMELRKRKKEHVEFLKNQDLPREEIDLRVRLFKQLERNLTFG